MKTGSELLLNALKTTCSGINQSFDEQIRLFNEIVTRLKSGSVKQMSGGDSCEIGDIASAFSNYESPCGIADAALHEVADDVRAKLAALVDKFEADTKGVS